MQNVHSIALWQQLLQSLAPVTGWLYIGAGRGSTLAEPRFAKVPRLLAVEADEHNHQLLAHATAPHKNWQAAHALVNNTDGQATWHQLSREEESGLLPATTLNVLWPNLTQQQSAKQPAVSIQQLLKQAGEDQEHYNWLTIDCLPAAHLLQGLNGALQTLDVIELRVAVGDIAPQQSGATLQECDALLLPQGFTRLALQQADNPLLGRALYGRDFARQLAEAQKLQSQNNALTAQYNELKASHDRLQKELQNTRSKLENQKTRELQPQEALQQAQTDLKEQQRSAQLSTKLLAKVEADASDLRERYAEKTKSEQELKDLIKELHAKLQAASHFYHKIEQEHPELLEKL